MDCNSVDPKLMKALLSEYAPIEALVDFMKNSAEDSEQCTEND